MLEAKGLTRRFGGLVAVADFDLVIGEGELVGVIGPNGAGKTTLFNLLSGFLRPDQGRIFFLSREITGLPPHRIARFGLVRTFQVVRPLARLTVFENVMAGALLRKNLAEARSWCEEVIGFCGLKPKMHQKAQDLTIADRKRLELARAVATAPKLILLDEVAAGLNPSEIDEVIRIIKDLKGLGIGAVVGVEHVMRFIMEISDRIIVMHHGKKISEGRPEEVVRDEKVLEAYLGKSYAQA